MAGWGATAARVASAAAPLLLVGLEVEWLRVVALAQGAASELRAASGLLVAAVGLRALAGVSVQPPAQEAALGLVVQQLVYHLGAPQRLSS